jgi:UDP-glucose 4-epimerase
MGNPFAGNAKSPAANIRDMSVLVTGGAGYIGSHVVRLLQQRGEKVVVVDNLTSGKVERIGDATLVKLDLSDPTAVDVLSETIEKHSVTSVIHFAAQKQVGVSVEQPEFYFLQNIGGMTNLLNAMRAKGVNQLVFSSSAATYGMPDVDMVTEDLVCAPINPYGETKLIGEWMTRDAARSWGLKVANLRYFNVAGTGRADLADTALMNLLPIVFAAIKSGAAPKVFGTDYPTADGSCVRDYVHVLDLAEAHLSALAYLNTDDRPYDVFNVGTGHGSSVLEVLAEVKNVTGIDFEIDLAERRAGDPPALCADVSRIEKTLGWKAKHNLHDIVKSAWDAIN